MLNHKKNLPIIFILGSLTAPSISVALCRGGVSMLYRVAAVAFVAAAAFSVAGHRIRARGAGIHGGSAARVT